MSCLVLPPWWGIFTSATKKIAPEHMYTRSFLLAEEEKGIFLFIFVILAGFCCKTIKHSQEKKNLILTKAEKVLWQVHDTNAQRSSCTWACSSDGPRGKLLNLKTSFFFITPSIIPQNWGPSVWTTLKAVKGAHFVKSLFAQVWTKRIAQNA